jgi:hypothetical protein
VGFSLPVVAAWWQLYIPPLSARMVINFVDIKMASISVSLRRYLLKLSGRRMWINGFSSTSTEINE